MEPTPKRAGRTAQAGSRFLADAVADNLHAFRSMRRLSQTELAGRMKYLGHSWSRATVSDVERAARNVTVDELFAAAVALRVSVPDLLDPAGPDGRAAQPIDFGRAAPMPARTVSHLLHGRAAVGLMGAPDGGGVVDESYEWRAQDPAVEAEVREDVDRMWRQRAGAPGKKTIKWTDERTTK